MDKKGFEPQWTDFHTKICQEFFVKHKKGNETYHIFYSNEMFLDFAKHKNLEPVYKTLDEYGNKELHHCEEPTWP